MSVYSMICVIEESRDFLCFSFSDLDRLSLLRLRELDSRYHDGVLTLDGHWIGN